jgi:uncharacterized protein YraI
VVVKSPVNLRTGPNTNTSVIRTTRRGETFRVHDRAPDGWVQVGEAEPVGWIYSTGFLEDVRP